MEKNRECVFGNESTSIVFYLNIQDCEIFGDYVVNCVSD